MEKHQSFRTSGESGSVSDEEVSGALDFCFECLCFAASFFEGRKPWARAFEDSDLEEPQGGAISDQQMTSTGRDPASEEMGSTVNVH